MIQELIDAAKVKYASLVTLEAVDAELAKGRSLEEQRALTQIRQHIVSVLESEILTQWLIANSIPKADWMLYAYVNGEVVKNG